MFSKILAQSDECLAFTEDSCSTAAYCGAAGVGDVGGLYMAKLSSGRFILTSSLLVPGCWLLTCGWASVADPAVAS